ncbi:syndecan-4 [Carettochelys insculpta]|uniref:syndecan-4 n=1 Tax=Carettochelys insculpta TaxID=44489 RepID=UPI003EB76622
MPALSARRPRALSAALLLLVAASVASAESVRETETMDPEKYGEDYFSSGALPDDEDIGDLRPAMDKDEWFSGSGDDDAETDLPSTTEESPVLSGDNRIPEDTGERAQAVDENLVVDNEIIPPKAFPDEVNPSNKISMASTAHSSLFDRTEVLAALIAGGTVGLLFAVFLILLLVYRMKKKDEGSYDLGKKPIYKKAPTNEFYA